MEEIPMKRLAFVLAATFLGSGCIVTDHGDCSTGVTLEWDFQQANGTVTGCGAAGVDEVDVYLDGNYVSTYACTSGGATIPVTTGGHHVTVEGIDLQAGRIAYRDARSFQAAGCGTQLVSVRPAEGTANLNYGDIGCTASPCYLWFSVHDDVANTPAAAIGTSSQASVKILYPYPGDVVL